jgi:Uma2 family endonuclease
VSTLAAPPDLHRLSIEEYHRVIRCGGLEEGARMELIDGLILDMSPKTPEHENALSWLIDWLVGHLDHSRYQHRVGAPLTIGSSEPEPDLAIVQRTAPRLEHPSGALLVVEVALSSNERDLTIKPGLYASVVEEYWVIDLQARHVVVHRDPLDGAYREITLFPAGQELTARAVEVGRLPTGELFAATFAEASPAASRGS